jgi:hypothetical protein
MPVAMLLGVMIILVSIPLLYNAIGPNRFYGFRTRKILSSPDLWYKANKYAARELVAAGMVIIMLAVGTMLVHLRVTMFTTIQAAALFIMVTYVPLVIAALRSSLYLKKL